MDSFGLRNLLCLILLHCIHQSGALGNVPKDLLGTANEEMRPSNPLKLIIEAKAKLGAACAWNKKSDVIFDVQRSTMNHVLTSVDPIVYDTVNVNFGGAYNSTTGIFTCPMCGTYFFSYSSLPGRGLQTDVALVKNKEKVSLIHSFLPANSSQLSIKITILSLHKGDKVWVKLVTGNLWSRAGSLSFQGFQLTSRVR
ncbi:complement C1q tumor necrosis factor-related protein 1-like [Carcharodon carcharias]|uniref:complement C1q tumor necrosis factor-related protein 1-like n=1 Tax=Carcharodon carcharias TaxID=13397 RepID=UPI001B7F7605|nr:complement C1q tumor necrosis factor-related protein 1-like [Carcharodon carcharias]